MADQNERSQLSSPAVHGGNSRGEMGPCNLVNIEQKLLIDVNQLSIGTMISDGKNSTVYEGLYRSIPVAVKVIQPAIASSASPEILENFTREVLILSRVNHDNIIQFVGAVVEPTMMIITELMKGGTLQKFLWNIRPNCPELKLSISCALEISQAMEYLHQNRIIHRDLKPSNLLLTEDQQKIKLADFGLARVEDDDEMTTEAGTYRWMAPELFNTEALTLERKKYYDHKVDVYSFSMILWELLTNTTPFKGRNSIMVAYAAAMNRRPSLENIPPQIAPFLQSCWAAKPEDRPEFVQITEFLERFLHDICQSTKTSASAPPPPPPPPCSLNVEHSIYVPAMDGSTNMADETKKKTSRNACLRFLSCFGYYCV